MITREMIELANSLKLVVSSIWDGYTRTYVVHEKGGYHPILTTNDYDRIMHGLRNGGRFAPL